MATTTTAARHARDAELLLAADGVVVPIVVIKNCGQPGCYRPAGWMVRRLVAGGYRMVRRCTLHGARQVRRLRRFGGVR